MKGTIVILGCLFAAYAAPLFANEVPLILDETIQLPVATGIWDVVPTIEGDYWWVSALPRETLATVCFGNSAQDDFDSVAQIKGSPLSLGVYIDNDAGPSCILCTNRGYEFNIGDSSGVIALDTTWVRFHSLNGWVALETGELHGSMNIERRWIPQPPGILEETNGMLRGSIVNFDFSPSAPFASQFCTGLLTFSSTHGYAGPDGGSGQHVVFREIHFKCALEFTTDSLTENDTRGYSMQIVRAGNLLYVMSCGAATHTVYNGGLSFWTTWSLALERIEGDSRETIHSASRSQDYWPAPVWPLRLTALTYDTLTNRALGMYMWGNPAGGSDITCVSSTDSARIVRTTLAPYSFMLVAKVLPDSASEQAIALRGDTLDVIDIATGQEWGNIFLSVGHSEMKIIGRYHNETRRLVVRYGSELRIYRFGEPIITDADDARPELPNELTLSAYPNPFNPTTMIAFDLPKTGRAKLVVYDLNGRLVQTLLDEQMSGGHHVVGFDGAALPSGIYFARLSAGELTRTHKLVLMK